MADAPAATATLRAQFAKNAVLPRRHIAAAEQFIHHVSETIKSGGMPSQQDIQQGQKLLRQIENRTEIYMFNAAILAGQDASTESDLERKLEAISNGITQAQSTSERLREALKKFG
jgi:hypothetical protein